MNASAHLTFRAAINATKGYDLSPNPRPAEWREHAAPERKIVAATAEYLRRCGRDIAECSHLTAAQKEAARDFHLTYRDVMAEWLDLIAAAEAAAENHEDECDAAFFSRPLSTPVTVQSYGSAGFIPRVSYSEAAE